MNFLLKLCLSAIFLSFVAHGSSSDDDSGASSGSVSGSISGSPDEPTRSPAQQALNALIRACPCFEELGGDGSDALEEVREECLDDGAACSFNVAGGSTSTLNCAEDQIVLNQAGNTCWNNEIQDNGDIEQGEQITLSAAQTAICAAALQGASDDFGCITPAPTPAPVDAVVCQQFTVDTSQEFDEAGADDDARTAFAQELIEQAVGDADVMVTINSVFMTADGNLGIVYTLCGTQAELDEAIANVAQAAADGTIFLVLGQPVSIGTPTEGTTTPAPVTPAPVTPAPVTPAPVTPAPVTPAPVTTSAPLTVAPVPAPTAGPVADTTMFF